MPKYYQLAIHVWLLMFHKPTTSKQIQKIVLLPLVGKTEQSGFPTKPQNTYNIYHVKNFNLSKCSRLIEFEIEDSQIRKAQQFGLTAPVSTERKLNLRALEFHEFHLFIVAWRKFIILHIILRANVIIMHNLPHKML